MPSDQRARNDHSGGSARGLGLAAGAAACYLAAWLNPTAAHGAVYEVYPNDDLYAIMGTLTQGDEVVIYEGTYHTPGYRMLQWTGTESEPVIVRAAAGESVVIVGDPSQNVLNIQGEHFVLSGVEVTSGSAGIRLYAVHDAVLEDLYIHHTAEAALTANIEGEDFYNIKLRWIHIHNTGGTGEGMYLGCNNGACTFRDSVVEHCYIHHTDQGTSQGDGIEIKDGSYNNLVRFNVIHDTQYPCIIVYGTGGNAPNVVEKNVMWSCADSGIQAAAEAVLQNNIILWAGNGINSHAHQTAIPKDLKIVNNTVVGCTDRCLRSSDWAGSTGIVVANNAFYCDGGNAIRIATGGTDITISSNVVVGAVEGVTSGFTVGNSAAADLTDPDNLDVWPTQAGPLIDTGDLAFAPAEDFNEVARGASPDVGAYEWSAGGNPGWDVSDELRPALDGGSTTHADGAVSDGSPPVDGSVASDASTDSDGEAPQIDGSTHDGSSSDSGCSCQAPMGGSSGPGSLFVISALLGLLVLLGVRRRRSQR